MTSEAKGKTSSAPSLTIDEILNELQVISNNVAELEEELRKKIEALKGDRVAHSIKSVGVESALFDLLFFEKEKTKLSEFQKKYASLIGQNKATISTLCMLVETSRSRGNVVPARLSVSSFAPVATREPIVSKEGSSEQIKLSKFEMFRSSINKNFNNINSYIQQGEKIAFAISSTMPALMPMETAENGIGSQRALWEEQQRLHQGPGLNFEYSSLPSDVSRSGNSPKSPAKVLGDSLKAITASSSRTSVPKKKTTETDKAESLEDSAASKKS